MGCIATGWEHYQKQHQKQHEKQHKTQHDNTKEQTAFKINSIFNAKGSSTLPMSNPSVRQGTLPNNDVNKRQSLDLDMVKPEFRRGEFVKIIYMKDSILNNYKGYNGEIREFNGEYAYITLEATNSCQRIRFPINHFIKRDFEVEKKTSNELQLNKNFLLV